MPTRDSASKNVISASEQEGGGESGPGVCFLCHRQITAAQASSKEYRVSLDDPARVVHASCLHERELMRRAMRPPVQR